MFVPVPTPEEMSRWDATAIALGIPEDVLMENASRAAMDCLREHLAGKGNDLAGKTVLLLAGGGNNGGDAFCMARHLLDAGAFPTLVCTREPERYQGAAGRWLQVAITLGIPVFSSEDWEQGHASIPSQPDIVVDGLLGTGFQGQLREREARLTAKLNALHAPFVLAVDIPSGLDSRIGLPCPDAVRAHVTVTFQAAKPGLLLPQAEAFTGVLDVRPIAMPRRVQEEVRPSFRTWLIPAQSPADHGTPYTIAHRPSPRLLNDITCRIDAVHGGPAHKGEAGKMLVIGGCRAYTGAPCLAALASLRTGAGLVSVAGPDAVLAAARAFQPALVMRELPQRPIEAPEWTAEDAKTLAPAVSAARAVVFGPGLGRTSGAADFAEALLNLPQRPPMVLDADALFALSNRPSLLGHLRPCDVLTPHPGEAAALLGISTTEVQADRFAALARLAGLAPAVWVLKGPGTLIAVPGQPTTISPWDVPQLAVAGSGDVLAGAIGALLARGLDAGEAAVLGVWLHILAGLHLSETFPMRGCGPHDIADALPSVLAAVGLPDKESSCPSS